MLHATLAALGAMKHGSRRRWLWALSALALAGACLSPTLPLPPPSDPELQADGQGRWQLSGNVGEAGVRVVASNWRTRLFWGQQTVGDGQYSFWIEADTGDVIEFWYEIGDEQSQSNLVVIPEADATGGAGGDSGAGGAAWRSGQLTKFGDVSGAARALFRRLSLGRRAADS